MYFIIKLAFRGEIFIKTSLSNEIHISRSKLVWLSEKAATISETSTGFGKCSSQDRVYVAIFCVEA